MIKLFSNHSFKKLILSILIIVVFLGMAFFGINRYTHRNKTDKNIFLKVGDLTLPTQAFLAEYNMILQQNMAVVMGHPELIANILQGMMSRYTSALLLANEADQIGVGVSHHLISKILAGTTYFQDGSGNFNQQHFHDLVSKIYGSEDAYLAYLKANIQQTQLAGTLVNSFYVPKKLNQVFAQSLAQTRKVDYVVFAKNDVKLKTRPTNAELSTLLKNNKDLYTIPEYRSFDLLELDVTDQLKHIQVTNAQIVAYYKAHQDEFAQPETRDVTLLHYDTLNEAQKAYISIKSYQSLEAHKLPISKLTAVSLEDLPNKTLAQAIYAAKEGVISEPTNTDMGAYIFVVTKIHAGGPLPLEKVKTQVKTEILSNELATLYEEKNKLLSEFSGKNVPLHSVLKTTGGKLIHVPLITKYGFNPHQQAITITAALKASILDKAFNTPLHTITDVIALNNKLYLLEINSIKPQVIKTLQQAKADLTKQWEYNEALKVITANAQTFVATYNAKHSMQRAQVKHITLSRTKQKQTLFNATDLNRIFLSRVKTPIQGNLQNGDIYVAIVRSINNANVNTLAPKEVTSINHYLNTVVKEGLLSELFFRISKNYKIVTNPDVLKQAMGATTGAQTEE